MKKVFVLCSVLILSGCLSQYATTGEYVYEKARQPQLSQQPKIAQSDAVSHYYDLPHQQTLQKASIEPPED